MKDLQKSLYEKSFLSPFKGFDASFANEWLKSVEQADTLSKLHTLYGILENSISWEKSSETMVGDLFFQSIIQSFSQGLDVGYIAFAGWESTTRS